MNDLRIENWKIELHKGRSETYYRLIGNIYNHPNYPQILNGEFAFTSKLVMIDFWNKRAQTQNNLYILGEQDEKTHNSDWPLEHNLQYP